MKLVKSDSAANNDDKQPSPAKSEKKANKPKAPSSVLLATLLGLVAAFALSFVLSQQVFDTQITQVRQQQLLEFSQRKAQLTANKIAAHFEATRQQIDFVLSKRAFRLALANELSEQISQYEASLSKQTKDFLALRYFRSSNVALEPEAFPPIRFTEAE